MHMPIVTVIITTYNRENTLLRAIDSLLKQTYPHFLLIIVDDGSTDSTSAILEELCDPRIAIIKHSHNMGVTAAKNTGLDHIKGEWFTFLDSDDEMVVNALEEMIQVVVNMDCSVTAVTCNCLDSQTQCFSGKGLTHDQYLDFSTIISKCSGEFWGITKSDLLQDYRFNNQLPGFEDTLWFRINEKAKRYYLHKALRIYHTEGSDRVSSVADDDFSSYVTKLSYYRHLFSEKHYIMSFLEYDITSFYKICFKGIAYSIYIKDNKLLKEYRNYIDLAPSFLFKLGYLTMIFPLSFLNTSLPLFLFYLRYTFIKS